ncbi:hypothetical protein ABPG72_020646 [Tetrahymena utriculariae]
MINGVDSIQSFINQELQLRVEAQAIQQFYNQIIQPLDRQQQFNSSIPPKLIEFIDYIIQEPFEKYIIKQKNNQLLERIKSQAKTFLEKDTLFEIVVAQNVSERNDTCASNTSNGCLKIIITDGVFAFTAIEVSKIPQIPTDLKQIRNKKILIRQNTKIQFNIFFINPKNAFIIQNAQSLIKIKEKPAFLQEDMYLNTTSGVLPQRITQDSQFFSNSNNQNASVNTNILKMIDQDTDEDDDDEELELQ